MSGSAAFISTLLCHWLKSSISRQNNRTMIRLWEGSLYLKAAQPLSWMFLTASYRFSHTLWRHQMETLSALLAIVAGNSLSIKHAHDCVMHFHLFHCSWWIHVYYSHDDVIKWKHFPRYWPFVRGIHRSRWIPRTKASDAELWCLLWSAPEFTIE